MLMVAPAATSLLQATICYLVHILVYYYYNTESNNAKNEVRRPLCAPPLGKDPARHIFRPHSEPLSKSVTEL